MDGSPSSGLEEIKPDVDDEEEALASKRRKIVQKTVVTVKVEANKNGKQKSEGPPPSDSWSWRKYGQKPIKGTPFPRGYYRCSTSKGCSAKKQVERCKTDTSMMIITYTSTHNHPSPDLSSTSVTNPSQKLSEHEQTNQNQTQSEEESELIPINTSKKEYQDQDLDPDQYNKVIVVEEEEHDHQQTDEEGNVFQYYSQSPFNSLIINHQREDDPFGENLFDRVLCNHHVFFDGGEPPLSLEPSSSSQLLPMEENDDGSFFDELEELPMFPSSFSRLMTFVQ